MDWWTGGPSPFLPSPRSTWISTNFGGGGPVSTRDSFSYLIRLHHQKTPFQKKSPTKTHERAAMLPLFNPGSHVQSRQSIYVDQSRIGIQLCTKPVSYHHESCQGKKYEKTRERIASETRWHRINLRGSHLSLNRSQAYLRPIQGIKGNEREQQFVACRPMTLHTCEASAHV